jgi:hypothetical protein
MVIWPVNATLTMLSFAKVIVTIYETMVQVAINVILVSGVVLSW